MTSKKELIKFMDFLVQSKICKEGYNSQKIVNEYVANYESNYEIRYNKTFKNTYNEIKDNNKVIGYVKKH